MSELVRRILTGAEYHSALRDLAYRFVNAGMPGGPGRRDLARHDGCASCSRAQRRALARAPGADPHARPHRRSQAHQTHRRPQKPSSTSSSNGCSSATSPCFRENGWHFWSSTTGCLVRPGEIMPDVAVIDALAAHPDAPHDNKGQRQVSGAAGAVSYLDQHRAQPAARRRLPTEEAATTICPAAVGRLRKRLQLLMATPVTLSWKERDESYERPDRVTENRTLARGAGGSPSRRPTNGAACGRTTAFSPASTPSISASPFVPSWPIRPASSPISAKCAIQTLAHSGRPLWAGRARNHRVRRRALPSCRAVRSPHRDHQREHGMTDCPAS